MALPFIEVLTLLCTGVFVGGMVLVMFAVVPSWYDMSPEQWIGNQQVLGPHIDWYMPVFDGLATLGAILLIVFHWPTRLPVITAATGVFGLAAVAIISQLVNVPINRCVRSWSCSAPPPIGLMLRKRWVVWHAVRTSAGLLAFIALLLSTLL